MACCFWTVTALMMMMMMMASPGARGFPVGDSSGDEEFDVEPCARISPEERSQPRASTCLAHWLQGTAASWNAELCKEQNICKGSMDILVQNNLHVLKITRMDGCYESFQKEACLRKLSSGLYTFQPFLEYIQETSNNDTPIWPGTQQLATNLRSMMNNPETVIMPLPENQKAISEKLREQKGWNAAVIKHHILQHFTSFMEKTIRAVRHL